MPFKNSFLKTPFLVILFISFCGGAVAQKSAVDSLKALILRSPEDTSKVNVMIRLANEYFWSGKYDSALRCANAADELATKLSFFKGQGSAMVVAGQSQIRSGRYDEAQEYFHKSVTIFSAINNRVEMASSHLYLGQLYDFKAEYNLALEQYAIARELATQVHDSVTLTKVMNSTGITNFNKGNYEVALEHYLSALKISRIKGNEKLYATVLNNIGVVHMQLEQFDEALKYFLRYVDLMKELKGTHGLGVGYMNVGEAYMKLHEYTKATSYLEEALVLRTQTSDKKGMALSHSYLGDVFKAQSRHDEALSHYNKSITLAREIENSEVLLSPLCGVGELHIRKGNFKMAQRSIEEARQLATGIGSKSWLQQTYLLSSRLDSARGDFRNAYTWFKKYSLLSDSLFNDQKSKQVFQMKELYDSERKDKEIRLLSEANKLSELQQANSRKLFAMSLAFLSLVILIILYWLIQKTRHSRILKRQKDELTAAHHELAVKNEDLQQLHREKDGLIGVVVHDLRAPLNRIFGLSQLVALSGDVNDQQHHMLVSINKVCDDGNRLIADLLELNEIEGAERCIHEDVNLATLVRDHVTHFSNQLSMKNLSLLVEDNSASCFVTTNTHYLKRILDNLLSNAIKFSSSGKRIWVSISQSDNTTAQITVRDEGPGFSKEDMPQLFQKFRKLSARPTAGESSTGLGLSIVKLLVEKIGGSITVESGQGTGAMFVISLPLSEALIEITRKKRSVVV